jgi:pilus assembly protein CpaE
MEQKEKTPLRIMIIAEYDPTFDWVHLSLQEQRYEIVGRFDSVELAWQQLTRKHVDVILADTSAEGVLETPWIQQVAVQSKRTLTLVIAANSEMEFVRKAMLAGAQGFLLKPFDLPELSRSIEQVHQLWLQQHALLAQATENSTAMPSQKGHSIAVFSPKGGTGVTTLAVNLAVALKQLSAAPILLVDADVHTADVDIFLNIFNKHSILDLVEVNQEIDTELLNSVATEHASGITVLQGNPHLQFIEAPVDPGQMSELIEQLKAIWEGYIVVNTSNSLDRATIEVIDTVDNVLVVATPQLSALRVVRNFLDLAEIHEDPGEKWQVVMTSYQKQKVLRMTDIEESIRYPIKATVAQDATLASTAINRGLPFLLSDRKSVIAKDIQTLAKQLVEANPQPQMLSVNGNGHSTSAELGDIQGKNGGKRFWNMFANPIRPSDKLEQPIS